MSIRLDSELLSLLHDEGTVKAVATVDATGAPYVAHSRFLIAEEGELVHLELLETSATNKNLLRTLWFGGRVSVTVAAADGRSWVVRGRPRKAVVTGPVFRRWYEHVRERLPDADLSAVWLIRPEEAVQETYEVRKAEEEQQFPFYIHLDRLTADPISHS